MNTMVIGIAGGTGSGKTTVTEKLQEYFGADVSVLHHDSYYKRHDELPFEKRRLLNYDHPDSFDTSLLIEDLRSLKAGHTVHCPVYDYSIHNRTDRTEEVHPTKVIIVEGILIFADEELADEMDIKILSIPMPMSGSFGAFCAMYGSAGARWNRSWSSILPPSSRCMSSMSNRASVGRISSCCRAVTIWLPWICSSSAFAAISGRKNKTESKRKGIPARGCPFHIAGQSTDFIDSTILIFFSR